jgi:hypothetical protein
MNVIGRFDIDDHQGRDRVLDLRRRRYGHGVEIDRVRTRSRFWVDAMAYAPPAKAALRPARLSLRAEIDILCLPSPRARSGYVMCPGDRPEGGREDNDWRRCRWARL